MRKGQLARRRAAVATLHSSPRSARDCIEPRGGVRCVEPRGGVRCGVQRLTEVAAMHPGLNWIAFRQLDMM